MIDRPECPECGSIDTIVLNGRVKLGKWCFQQRHQCRGCGQKFLSWWTGGLLRKYGDKGLEIHKGAHRRPRLRRSLGGSRPNGQGEEAIQQARQRTQGLLRRSRRGLSLVRPPRPICLDEPCIAWNKERGYCGHQVLEGPESCIFYDPEREQQRQERMKRKAMEGKK